MATSFADLLKGDGPVLLDGAMGTQLYAKGVFVHRAFEEANLAQPALVREVHAEYVAAGAQILETNTFAANRFRLSAHGLAAKVKELNVRGAELAREAAKGRALVAGSMGPLGVRIEPFGPTGRGEAREVFAEQAGSLAKGGVDLFVLETFTHLPEIEEAVRAVRGVSKLPVIAQLSVATGGCTREGVAAGEAAARLVAAGADVVGVNCSEALAALEALEAMRAAVEVPLSGQPNAGQPRSVEGRNLYLASPEYLVAWAKRALRAGVRFLGGCCGTTPEHIRALRSMLHAVAPEAPPIRPARARRRAGAARAAAPEAKSKLAVSLARGEFVKGVELPAPAGWAAEPVVEAARRLAEAGVSFVSLPETRGGLPPAVLGQLCARVEGIEPLVHYSCRLRRLPRMQSDLLGAWAMGLSNLLLVTGAPWHAGADAEQDLDVDSIGAVNLAARLNHGEDMAGNPIGAPTRFHMGVRLDATAPDRARELSRMRWKVEAGAEFAVTAPVFDPAALASILREAPKLPVIATIWPLRSAREAEFFEQQMADVPVPKDLVRRMGEAEGRGEEEAEGVAIARELCAAVRPLVQGILVAAPDGDVSRVVRGDFFQNS
ncbi:MAG TPA: bifunctional homocysteine S-methyltransferase/methylenetetrahydrofolate reductase [Planctomycetota bacterium]|nr:bifunctional homocysteine S-methyltransferase/methylenetetrahydrofolate reductase [Planctomycetota bacterium]